MISTIQCLHKLCESTKTDCGSVFSTCTVDLIEGILYTQFGTITMYTGLAISNDFRERTGDIDLAVIVIITIIICTCTGNEKEKNGMKY